MQDERERRPLGVWQDSHLSLNSDQTPGGTDSLRQQSTRLAYSQTYIHYGRMSNLAPIKS